MFFLKSEIIDYNSPKKISRQAGKLKGTRLARISSTLKLKKKVEEKTFPVKKEVRVKVRVRVREEGKIHLEVQCP